MRFLIELAEVGGLTRCSMIHRVDGVLDARRALPTRRAEEEAPWTVSVKRSAPPVRSRRCPWGPWGPTATWWTTAGGVVVVDPGDDAAAIVRSLAGRPVSLVLVTHNHFDHVGHIDAFVAQSRSGWTLGAVDTAAPAATLDASARDFGHRVRVASSRPSGCATAIRGGRQAALQGGRHPGAHAGRRDLLRCRAWPGVHGRHPVRGLRRPHRPARRRPRSAVCVAGQARDPAAQRHASTRTWPCRAPHGENSRENPFLRMRCGARACGAGFGAFDFSFLLRVSRPASPPIAHPCGRPEQLPPSR